MKKVTNNTEFIIGIDFGHGETSAAFYNLKTQEKFDLDILPGHKVIKSAVAILEQEGQQTICVGDAAIANAPMAKDFQVSFKKRPSEMSQIDRARMVAFMKGVYSGILDRHPDYRTREHVVYIARPSQDKLWKSEETAYLKIAEDAGLPVAGIQKESRAAYFRARTQPDSKIDQQVKKGVLIVDFGSSTIDFTYLNGSSSAPIDDGRPLGASQVEKSLLEYALNNPSDAVMPQFAALYGRNEDSNPYNQLLYKFREAKEAFYGKKLPIFSVAFDYGYLTSSEKQQLFGFGGISIPKQQLDQILGKNVKGGYIQNVKDAVIAFKNEKLKDNQVSCVYLTGGASRMDFVREIFMEVFGLDASHCPQDDFPERIVSQGVAHLSYADIKTSEKEVELKNIAQNAIASYNWEGNFKSIIGASIKAKIIDKAWTIMMSYRDGNIGEYMTITNDHAPNGQFVNMEFKNEENGYHLVHNIRGLNSKIDSEFKGWTYYDFIPMCKDSIESNVISSVISKLNTILTAFNYETSSSVNLNLTGLSASISSDGINELCQKFTGGSKSHVIYDAVASCWLAMDTFNVWKDRWESDRKQHYEYYRTHYSDIFSSWTWEQFLKNRISISGIEQAKRQTKKYIDDLINEYVSYAKLAMFFTKK